MHMHTHADNHTCRQPITHTHTYSADRQSIEEHIDALTHTYNALADMQSIEEQTSAHTHTYTQTMHMQTFVNNPHALMVDSRVHQYISLCTELGRPPRHALPCRLPVLNA